MWSIDAWEKIKIFFPDNNNRSRIIVTTRLSNLASHFSASYLSIKFLGEDKSWYLFCEKGFAPENCPPDLEFIGKKIAKKCKGLPLSIAVIGALLGKSSRTEEYWENISVEINSIPENEHCLDILSLSYRHLSAHLKPCFLYMGVFPEDHEIRVSRLIKLWVAEGFLKPNKTKSLEEVAEGYLKDLVDRNLILVYRSGLNGKLKTCTVHDLLRELCTRVAEKEKFFCVMKKVNLPLEIPRDIDRERRIVYHENIGFEDHYVVSRALKSATLARSLICKGDLPPFQLKLLRVLNVVDDNSREEVIWNVQTLIVSGQYISGSEQFDAPPEIWEMPQLRHLELDRLCLPDPPSSDQQDDFAVLRGLLTLKRVVNFRLSKAVCTRIPNIKKLHLYYDDFSARPYEYCLNNLGRLHKLESIYCIFCDPPNRDDLLQNFTFPSSLKKFCLENCNLQWEDLTLVGSLPHLEVLKLKNLSIIGGAEWNPVEGEFPRLKVLKIHCPYLIYWNADSSHFPVLEKLVLEYLCELDEIPSGIGDIPTLGFIHLIKCSESAAISAMKILEEQESLGNDGLQV